MHAMTTHLPPPGSPAHEVLMEALAQYTDNLQDHLEYTNPEDRDPKEVESLRVADVLLDKLTADFIQAVGV